MSTVSGSDARLFSNGDSSNRFGNPVPRTAGAMPLTASSVSLDDPRPIKDGLGGLDGNGGCLAPGGAWGSVRVCPGCRAGDEFHVSDTSGSSQILPVRIGGGELVALKNSESPPAAKVSRESDASPPGADLSGDLLQSEKGMYTQSHVSRLRQSSRAPFTGRLLLQLTTHDSHSSMPPMLNTNPKPHNKKVAPRMHPLRALGTFMIVSPLRKKMAGVARVPLTTLTFLGINIGVYVIQMLIPVPLSWFAIAAAPVLHGQVHRLVTSALMHMGILHIVMNMMSFYYMGLSLVRHAPFACGATG